jgi:hypothetical protein
MVASNYYKGASTLSTAPVQKGTSRAIGVEKMSRRRYAVRKLRIKDSSHRIQGGLTTGEQRISTWPKRKISSTTQIRPSSETQIWVEVSFYIWHCPQDGSSKYLEELHAAAHTFLPQALKTLLRTFFLLPLITVSAYFRDKTVIN